MDDKGDLGCGIFTGIIITIAFVIFYTLCNKNPKAIDVYRGKTTLEITYKDGIPIDSIVVFK